VAAGVELAYFVAVRRLSRILLPLLAVAQLLLSLPAMASASAGSGPSVPCDEMAMHDDGDCPCCPDGTDSMNDCLTSCTLGAALIPCTPTVIAVPHVAADFAEIAYTLPTLADPPVKPPPIA
jgi:hypothetical protein